MDKKKNINTNSYNKVNNKLNNLSKTNTKEDSPTEFIKKIGDFFNKNFVFIVLISILICICILTYFYSDIFRPSRKIKQLTKNLTYNKDRERIDFCGDDNFVNDTIRGGVILNKSENSITFKNKHVNLYNLGLSSEYYINIENTNNNNNSSSTYYKVSKVTNYNKLLFQRSENSESVKQDEDKSSDVVVTYFRPSSNQNIYKHKLLTDYYICSSYNSFLIGKHKLDYCDVNMLNRALHFGARYLELEILNKEVKNFTEPIVCTGIEKGNIITSLNYLMFDDCIKTISQYAFSEKGIVNYNDPLFLFLNLKTGTNFNTEDIIHDIIVENLGKYMLDKSYNHVNISKLTLCEIRKKVVILTNRTCPNSRLNNIITCSTDKPYLKRIHMKDLDRFKDSKKPKLELTSRNVQFNNDLDSYVTIYDSDLEKSGIKPGDFVQINNANNPMNNSGLSLNKIKNVKQNMLIFETQGLFDSEKPGAQVILKIYDESYVTLEKGLEEYNKNNMTIVIPDSEFYSSNHDYKRAHYKGCQFVTMNFQKQDKQMEKYFRQFQKRSFQFKPEVLINEIILPKAVSLNSLVPKEKTNAEYSVDYNFLANIGKEGFLKTSDDVNMKLINDDRDVKISMTHNSENSKITIVKALNRKADSISIKCGTRYLHTNNSCCYLYFTELPDDDAFVGLLKVNEFKNNASFIPLKPNSFKKGFNSFGIKKNMIINRESVEFLYTLRLRNYFRPKQKIYTKNVSKYEVKFEFNLGDGEGEDKDSNDKDYSDSVFYERNVDDNTQGDVLENDKERRRMVVLKPVINVQEQFYPVGDIIVSREQCTEKLGESITTPEYEKTIKPNQTFRTIIYGGAVDRPKDYELIYDNKYFTSKNRPLKKSGVQFSVWKPVPNNGYSSVGVVFTKGYQKPSLNEVVCISNEYLKEVGLYKKPLWYHSKSGLIFWKNKSNNYAQVFNNVIKDSASESPDIPVMPNPIDNLIFDVITEEKDYSSRIYLDKNKLVDDNDKRSSIFSFVEDKKPNDSGFGVYDYLMEIEDNKGKIMSYNTSGDSKMCISLPQPYWTQLYDLRGENPESASLIKHDNYELDMEQCKGEKYVGTNWNIYDDKTIRLKDYEDYCATYNSKPGTQEPYYGTNNDKSNIFLTKCRDDLRDQQFLMKDNNIKLYNPNANENKYCMHHSKNNDLKVDTCGADNVTLLYKWGDEINRVDKCSLNQMEKYMEENINHIKHCVNKNYYVIYRQKIDETNRAFKYKLICNEEEAKEEYENIKGKHNVVALYHEGTFLETQYNGNKSMLEEKLKTYAKGLNSLSKYCNKCSYPDRILCQNNTYIEHEYNHTSNVKVLEELVSKCTSLPPSLKKCEKDRRQKFITDKNDPSFCLSESKEVFIYIFDKSQFSDYNTKDLSINLSRGNRGSLSNSEAKLPQRIDNLLAEPIDYGNYHIFVKGLLKQSPNSKFYTILIDTSVSNSNGEFYKENINIPKTSYDIFLNRPAKYDDLDVGTKVLVDSNIESQPNNGSYAGIDLAYKYKKSINDTDSVAIPSGNAKWLAVVVEKMKNNYVKVVLSINSYESDKRRISKAEEKMRPYSSINLTKIVRANDLILLRKAPVCG
jgi:hypothetical protein